MIKYVSPSPFLLTNIKHQIPQEWNELKNFAFTDRNIKDLGTPIEKICLLDSESNILLSPDDAEKFSHFLIGGILGNTDEFDFDRTRILRDQNFPTRNLGSVQMTSDTAMKVVKMIIVDGINFEKILFSDRPEISISPKEKLVINFRFLSDDSGMPIMAPGIREILLNEKHDFDFENLE